MPVLASHWILRIVLANQRPPLPLVARNIQPVSLSKITLQRPFRRFNNKKIAAVNVDQYLKVCRYHWRMSQEPKFLFVCSIEPSLNGSKGRGSEQKMSQIGGKVQKKGGGVSAKIKNSIF